MKKKRKENEYVQIQKALENVPKRRLEKERKDYMFFTVFILRLKIG